MKGGRLVIATHMDQSNHLANQQQVLGFAVPFASLGILCKNAGLKPFCSAKQAGFDFSSTKLCCTVHFWSCSNYTWPTQKHIAFLYAPITKWLWYLRIVLKLVKCTEFCDHYDCALIPDYVTLNPTERKGREVQNIWESFTPPPAAAGAQKMTKQLDTKTSIMPNVAYPRKARPNPFPIIFCVQSFCTESKHMESIIPLTLHPLTLYGVQSAKQYLCVTMRNEESMRDETYKHVMLRKGVNISEQ